MKKSIVLASTLALFFVTSATYAAPCPVSDIGNNGIKCEQKRIEHQRPPMSPEMKAKMEKKKAEFDKKLNLTDEQKAKAEQIRKDGFEKMKPVMDQIKVKKDERREIREND